MRAEISTLLKLNIYTDKGVYIGKVNDVILDPNESKITGLAVGNINDKLFDIEGNKGIVLPYRWVIAVADVILIKQMVHRLKKSKEEEEEED
jgi:sporulation protein YlmC with PRC-barrel domain